MVFLSWVWNKPCSSQEQELQLNHRDFNYDTRFTSDSPLTDESLRVMKRHGYALNHSRVKIGQGGEQEFNKAKELLQHWRHFQLGWAFVPPRTPIEIGQGFLVCSRELLVWIVNPLRVRYVHNHLREQSKEIYAFGSGTLRGHLLAGEERFAVEWNKEDESIWYEIFSFSKPAHLLSAATYPYVRFKQHLFAKQSSEKMIQEMCNATSTPAPTPTPAPTTA